VGSVLHINGIGSEFDHGLRKQDVLWFEKGPEPQVDGLGDSSLLLCQTSRLRLRLRVSSSKEELMLEGSSSIMTEDFSIWVIMVWNFFAWTFFESSVSYDCQT